MAITFSGGVTVTGGMTLNITAANDPYFMYVPLLLESTSTDAQTNNTFLDSSTNNFTITRNGTTTQGSLTPYWPNGYWSNYLDGSSYLTTPSGVNYVGGAGDFTIEFWFMPTGLTGQGGDGAQGIIGGGTSSNGSTSSISIRLGSGTTQATKRWQFWISGYNTLSAGTSTVSYNTWNHVALVRSGSGTNNCKLYINGALECQQTSTYTVPTTYGIYVGRTYSDNAAELSNGYISNLRILSGTALYTTTFTPPTAPLTAITNTTLLTCQSNRFFDSNTQLSAKTVSVGGGAPTVQAFQPFSPTASYTAAAYGGSGYFDAANTPNSLLRSPTVSYTSPSFTVECWFYFTGSPSGQAIFDFAAAANGYGMFAYIDSGTSNISARFFSSNSPGSEIGRIDTPYAKYLSQWVHIAVVFDGTTYKMYLNGVSVGTPISSTTQVVTLTTLTVGGRSDTTNSAGSAWVGYISNFRYVRSVAVYTGNFTPPTLAPITSAGSTSAASYSSTTNVNTSFASSNTILLLNCTNAGIYDAAVQNNQITVGSAQVSTTTAKWSPTSMKFNGTTDYLTIKSNPTLNFSTDSFTVEAWVYLSGMSGDYFVISATGSGGAFFGFTGGTNIGYGRAAIAWDYNIASGVSTGAWYHLAWSRSGTSMRIFVNGTQVGTTQTTSQAYDLTTTSTTVGSQAANFYLNGYIQDLRVTTGVGRYTANFSVPTAAFPTQ